MNVQASTHTHRNLGADRLPCGPDEFLLAGHTHRNEENVRTVRGDLSGDHIVAFRWEKAVPRAHDVATRVSETESLCGHFRDAGSRAEKENPPTEFRTPGADKVHQVDAADSLSNGFSDPSGGPKHPDAVRCDEIRLSNNVGELRILLGKDQTRGIRRDNHPWLRTLHECGDSRHR